MPSTSYQPWYTSQDYPSWDIPLNTDAATDDITNVDITKFTMIFHNTNTAPPTDTIGTGTFSVKTLSPAEIYYKPSAADVASAFSGTLIIKALFPPSNSSADAVIYDPIPFVITAS